MNLFEKKYVAFLKEELINSSATWNSGYASFFLDPSVTMQKARHRKPFVRDPGTRKHVQTVPDMHKNDPNEPLALKNLKASASGRKILSQDEIEQVCTRYNISRTSLNQPKKLGNTGIILKFDPSVRGYVIQK